MRCFKGKTAPCYAQRFCAQLLGIRNMQVRIRGELVLKQCYVSSLMLRPSKSLLPCPYGLSIGLESRSLMGMKFTPFALLLRDERKFSAAVEFIVHCIVNYSVNIESYR